MATQETIKQMFSGGALRDVEDVTARQLIAQLQAAIDEITGGDTTTAIKTFQEVIDFLDGVTDDATLIGKLNELRTLINAKYTKPSTGIPATDLAGNIPAEKLDNHVQVALAKADTALQPADVDNIAKVFNAEFVTDVSSLEESNPNLDNFIHDPSAYEFKRQWGRRDFYNKADSYMIRHLDLTTDVFNAKSNIMPTAKGAFNTISWSGGRIVFSSPITGKTDVLSSVQVDSYFPYLTHELAIGDISGNSTIGIAFGESNLSDSLNVDHVKVLVTSLTTISVSYSAGGNTKSTLLSCESIQNKVLVVQNTGRAVLIWTRQKNGILTFVGRVEYSATIDARALSFLDTWKTYVVAGYNAYNENNSVAFRGYSSRLSSGANSVSLRFFTYEDGTFIQKGRYLFACTEGTGKTIADLYTQIARIDLSSGDIQMIGAIFQTRSDEDTDVLIADDSIKVLYDRNANKWRGISCGMDYIDSKGTYNRPKLYFETEYNLLSGGLVIVDGSTKLMADATTEFGVGESNYCEDIDFYYDDVLGKWRLTGNKITQGLSTYLTTDNTFTNGISIQHTSTEAIRGLRDTGNQFIKIGGVRYITAGGTANKLFLRNDDLSLKCELNIELPLAENTNGPWCTIVPYNNCGKTEMWLLSFDRSDLLLQGFETGDYDHGGLYAWKAVLVEKNIIGITIVGDSAVAGSGTFSAVLNPQDTTQANVVWSIVSGSDYATINQSGVLSVKSTATSAQSVTIKCQSVDNSSVYATKVVRVIYSGEVSGAVFKIDAIDSAKVSPKLREMVSGSLYTPFGGSVSLINQDGNAFVMPARNATYFKVDSRPFAFGTNAFTIMFTMTMTQAQIPVDGKGSRIFVKTFGVANGSTWPKGSAWFNLYDDVSSQQGAFPCMYYRVTNSAWDCYKFLKNDGSAVEDTDLIGTHAFAIVADLESIKLYMDGSVLGTLSFTNYPTGIIAAAVQIFPDTKQGILCYEYKVYHKALTTNEIAQNLAYTRFRFGIGAK